MSVRIRKFRTTKWQFELVQEQDGNRRLSYVLVREIGPRGGLGRPFTPDYLDLSGIDYGIAREQLVQRCFLIASGQRLINGVVPVELQ